MASSVDRNSGPEETWYITEELPRGVGYGQGRHLRPNPAFPVKSYTSEKDVREAVYLGMSANGAWPMILKRTYAQDKSVKAPDPPIPINDEVGRGLLIQFTSLQGNMACQLIPHWVFCCPGVLSMFKQWLNQDPDLGWEINMSKEVREMMACYGGTRVWKPLGLSKQWLKPLPSVHTPGYKNASQQPPWDFPIAFKDYGTPSAIRDQLEHFRAAHPKDRLPMGLLTVALFNYHYLKSLPELPQEKFEPSVMKSLGRPPLVPLGVFLIYFCVNLRRTTLLELVAFPNSFRFAKHCYDSDLELYGGRMKVNLEAINEPALMKLMDELGPKPVAKLLPSDIHGSTIPAFVDLSESELGCVQNTSEDRKTALQATVSTIGDIRGFGFLDPAFTSARFHRVLRHRDTYSHYEPKPIKWIADRDLDIPELTKEQHEKGFMFHSPVEDGGRYIVSTHMTVLRRTHHEDESGLEGGPASVPPATASLEQLKLERFRLEGMLSTITEETNISKFAFVDALESALAAESILKAREDNEVQVTDRFRDRVNKLRREADMRESAKDELENSKTLLEKKLKDVARNIDELQRKTAESEANKADTLKRKASKKPQEDDAKRARMSSDTSDEDDFLDTLTKEDRDYYIATRDFPIAGVLMSTAQANVVKARVQKGFRGIAKAQRLQFGRDYIFNDEGLPVLPPTEDEGARGNDEEGKGD
ncbi:hypothetical protein DL766_006258 [Monosporascus sp. MC13-8B]|uniref:Uncharacterized protein n=1 Tax=Monosporascus cannonballus TaxID=155416 RepID=A0ABY0HDQ0_9PEZI|nr:hypothetical protein DL762_003867 [Monosporascus cannonballus]RYO92860.1 hypothetical protein DL763_004585 [Monosporascus cannonballus]RYP27663.1 hypothetical protein DL766_006258 [Monosporascus sp. MC13-8B]